MKKLAFERKRVHVLLSVTLKTRVRRLSILSERRQHKAPWIPGGFISFIV
jgi:hypothetical protein